MRKFICTAISDLFPMVAVLAFVTALLLTFCLGCIGKEPDPEQSIRQMIAPAADHSKITRWRTEDIREALRSGEFQFPVAGGSTTER